MTVDDEFDDGIKDLHSMVESELLSKYEERLSLAQSEVARLANQNHVLTSELSRIEKSSIEYRILIVFVLFFYTLTFASGQKIELDQFSGDLYWIRWSYWGLNETRSSLQWNEDLKAQGNGWQYYSHSAQEFIPLNFE